jgi:dTDP-4-amino-4,6-dideoxygalactose transaminase
LILDFRGATPQMQVPLLDLKAQYAALRDDIEAAIRAVCETQRFVLGPSVTELERRVAAYSQSKFGIGVSSGTDALLVALMAYDIGPGDEVVTTPYSFFATAGVVARLGARPVFCDIDESTFNLSPAAVDAFIAQHCEFDGRHLTHRRTGGRVRLLMPVHLYGQMADMDALTDIAGRYSLPVVEDAAQAIGASLADGRRAGSLGAIGCFSFFPTKNLGAFGDAGMCVTADAGLAERLRVLRVHGGEPKYYHALVGGNFRLDELQAAVLLVKLEQLDRWTEARQRNAEHYTQLLGEASLAEHVTPPAVVPGFRHIFNQYVIRAARRDELRAYLTQQGVGTEIYYPVPLHEQRCFAYLGHAPEDFPAARRAARQTLALPVYPELTAEQREYVVDRIAAFYRG